MAAIGSQRAENAGLGQPHDRRAAQAGATGEIVDRSIRPLAAALDDPFRVRLRQSPEHAEAEAEGSGRWAVGRAWRRVLSSD